MALSFLEDDDYAKIGLPYASKPVSMACERPPSYNHLARTGVINPVPDDLESCPPASYDQLDRTTSWGRSPLDEAGYNVIDRSKGSSFSATYDRLDRGVVAVAAVSRFSFSLFPHFIPGGVLSIFVLRGCAVFQGIVFTYFF